MQTKSLQVKETVFFILPEFPPSFGGMQAHAVKMVEYFKRHYNLVVFVYKTKKGEYPEPEGYTLKPVLSRLSYYYNVEVILKEAKKYNPKFIYSSTVFYGLLKHYIDIPVIARSIGNDILRPWLFYPFKLGRSIISSDLLEDVFIFLKSSIDKPPYLSMLFQKYRKFLVAESIKKTDIIFANSDFTYSLIEQYKNDNVFVLPGGVDTNIFYPADSKEQIREKLNLPKDKFILINACRFVEKKGLMFLLENVKQLTDIYDDLMLLLIGDGPQRKKLLNYSKDINNIIILPPQPKEILADYYRASDVFVSTSYVVENPATKEKDVETMGRSLCEANACGLPLLSSKTGGTTSVITHNYNGLFFEELNSYDFTQKFKLLYRNDNLRKRLGHNGSKVAATKWDWSYIMRRHEEVFSEF